jgi:RNA polymerase sigma-70 factor (ECF subfamily)
VPLAGLDFADLFREQYPRIYRYVRYRVDDELTAEDLTAEVFERAYRFRDSYDPARSAFSTWLMQIAHNWVNNHLISQNRQQQHEVDPGEEMVYWPAAEKSLEAQTIARETVARLLNCVDHLSSRDRQVIALESITKRGLGSRLR